MSVDHLIAQAIRGVPVDEFPAWVAAMRAAGATLSGPVEIPPGSGRLAHELVVGPAQRLYIRQGPDGLFHLWQPPTGQ
jgi:hypothetical protein